MKNLFLLGCLYFVTVPCLLQKKLNRLYPPLARYGRINRTLILRFLLLSASLGQSWLLFRDRFPLMTTFSCDFRSLFYLCVVSCHIDNLLS